MGILIEFLVELHFEVIFATIVDGGLAALLSIDFHRAAGKTFTRYTLLRAALVGGVIGVVGLTAGMSILTLFLVTLIALPVGLVLVETWVRLRSELRQPKETHGTAGE